MDNQNLSAFINVAETNSFSEAAFLLDVTQSTISKRIALLESKIGKRLFDRIATAGSLSPKQERSCCQERASFIKEYESALQAINDLSGKDVGSPALGDKPPPWAPSTAPALKELRPTAHRCQS